MDRMDIERLWQEAANVTTNAKFYADDPEVQAAAEAFKSATAALSLASLRAEQRAAIERYAKLLDQAKGLLATYETMGGGDE